MIETREIAQPRTLCYEGEPLPALLAALSSDLVRNQWTLVSMHHEYAPEPDSDILIVTIEGDDGPVSAAEFMRHRREEGQ